MRRRPIIVSVGKELCFEAASPSQWIEMDRFPKGGILGKIIRRRGVPLRLIAEGFVWIRDGYDDRFRFLYDRF